MYGVLNALLKLNDFTESSILDRATLEGCCNVCYFGIPNCIQAFWYSYQGCVVQQAVAPTGTGVGVSSVCPNGKISGLTYNRDSGADVRSTGDIAGPCGQFYNNF